MRITLPVLTLALLSANHARGEDALTLRAGTLLDGQGGRSTGVNLVVRGTKIAAVGGPAEGAVFDLSRLTVLPGVIDTHVHIDSHIDRDGQAHNEATGREPLEQGTLFGAENAAATLLAGITTVQSLGATTDRDLREFAARGLLPIPRILTSLDWITEGDEETLRRTVRERVAGGADVIKIFASKSIREGGLPTLTEVQLRAACGEAKTHGRRSVVHAHASEAIRRAAAAGCTTIEHGALADQEALEAMATHGMFFDPNVYLVFQNYFDHEANFLGQGNYTKEGFAQMRKAAPAVVEVFKKALQTPGLKIVFGTDAVAGAHGRNFEELVFRVQHGGQDPMAALVSATSLAAASLGLESSLGRLAPGFEADVIAVDGDPLTDITTLRRVVFVMKGGRIYKNVVPRGP